MTDSMSTPSISVVITTYNYGRFVEQAIESVLAQQFPREEMEVVVVDDGSTDDTADRVRKYKGQVRYFYQENGGQASALNLGFAKVRGDIVVLLDADDFLLPTRLARVREAFQQNPASGMVYHRLLEWDVQTDERKETDFGLISGDFRTDPAKFFYYRPHPTSAVAFRRSTIGPLLPIPEEIRMTADGYIIELVLFLAPVLAIPEALVVYRIHGSNSYYYRNEAHMPWKARVARARMGRGLVRAMRRWLAGHGYTRKEAAVRYFLCRWSGCEVDYLFPGEPGRIRFFWYLLRENYAHAPVQGWKLTAFNYLAAFSALVFGRKNEQRMYQLRQSFLDVSRPVRDALGLRSRAARGKGSYVK
jgi:glycosyltransferase involved in cell wall biosynthesis